MGGVDFAAVEIEGREVNKAWDWRRRINNPPQDGILPYADWPYEVVCMV